MAFTAPAVQRYAHGQSTNVELFGSLAVDCLGEVPDTARSFLLSAPIEMPYVRSALTEHWLSAGLAVYLVDSTRAVRELRNLSRLRYSVEDAGVEYERISKRMFRRRLWLALHYDMTSPDGRLTADDRCRKTHTDELADSLLDTIQPDPYAEARSLLTGRAGPGRFVEPIVLGTAIATVVYLFFTVRS